MISDEDEPGPSADGIHCLRCLAEEAAMLKLGATLAAIEKAMEVVMAEGRRRPAALGRQDIGAVLH
jgi:hypothetical protein